MIYLIEDLKAVTKGKLSATISTIFFNPGFKSILRYRVSNFLYYRCHLKILPKLISYISRNHYAIDIDYRSHIGPGFRVVHGIGVVIGYDVCAGKNFTVYQGVTVGGNMGKVRISESGKSFSQPYIE